MERVIGARVRNFCNNFGILKIQSIVRYISNAWKNGSVAKFNIFNQTNYSTVVARVKDMVEAGFFIHCTWDFL